MKRYSFQKFGRDVRFVMFCTQTFSKPTVCMHLRPHRLLILSDEYTRRPVVACRLKIRCQYEFMWPIWYHDVHSRIIICAIRSRFLRHKHCTFQTWITLHRRLYEAPGGNQVDGLPPASSWQFTAGLKSSFNMLVNKWKQWWQKWRFFKIFESISLRTISSPRRGRDLSRNVFVVFVYAF